ncbi:hemicentin-1-like isoform X2 [Ruditapes philippinarum]|uniref:hemicentin-1-like isoform X2 n=1 Tax=Ruditapes philippinarum TaxID=129788 RepID=UPI00295B1D78|nr:hemicentin-1-like isoform X2 [Ruditapes philippinarum]
MRGMIYSCVFLFLVQAIRIKASDCQDDKSMDCAKLDKLFDICKDIHDAKLVCRNFCNLCSLVDGKWADWSHWSECDVTCGNGKHSRVRTCTNPAPSNQGLECTGNKVDDKPCTRPSCPVHGGWSSWSNWSACPVTCGIGMQKRHRNCSNPYPLRYGDHCFGDALEYRICDQELCDDGVWGNWEQWGTCGPTCDSGLRQRFRSCAKQIGTICEGRSNDVHLCNTTHNDCIQTCTSKPADTNLTNVALRKNVLLSSTHPDFKSSWLVDGNLATMAHTLGGRNPYALVDLEDVYRIFYIHIVNRKDCCAFRTHDVVIQVGLKPSSLFTVARHKSAIGAKCTFSFEHQVRGRYVKIMLEAMDDLNILELEVFA